MSIEKFQNTYRLKSARAEWHDYGGGAYAEILLFVVMPNHWHAIVFVDGDKTPYIRRDTDNDAIRANCRDVVNIRAMKGWLSVAIGGLKSSITKFANDNKIDFAWQTRFHDHIIRDTTEMNRIADYIENNPDTWDTDCFNE